MINLIQISATPVMGFLTLLSNVVFVAVVVVVLAHAGSRAKLYHFVHKYILQLLFLAILSAVVGSMIYSDVAGFPPCDLCWWQRILMYPQLIIVIMALYRKDKTVIDYLVPFSILGAILSLFQSLVQWGFSFGAEGGCTAVGGECAKVYFTEYSYITIPFMSFSVFVYIIVMKYIYYSHRKNNNG